MKLPLNGMPNQKMAMAVIITISIKAIIANGTNLPIIYSLGLSGETLICSMVPASRSLTIDIAVSIIVIREISIAITPGR